MDKPLLVLHLSDLHFGPHGRFAGQDMRTLALRFWKAVDAARAELGFEEKVALVIVTGDIAETARPQEYEQASAFFADLTNAMGLARRYVVFVPGNHDVSWVDTKKVSLDQEDELFDHVELERRIQGVKLRKYEAFVKAFHAQDEQRIVQPLSHGAYLITLPDLQISVAALNSCERESHLQQGGFLSEAQSQALMEQWRRTDADGWIKIIAIHHNPVATVPANVASWVEYLKTKRESLKGDVFHHFAADAAGFDGRERLRVVAQDCSVQVVLHGHHHARDTMAWNWHGRTKGQTQILSSGSWGLVPDRLPEGQPAMMHLFRLDPERAEIRSVLRVYDPRARSEGVVEPGTFAMDPAEPMGATLHLSVPKGLKQEKPQTPGGPRMAHDQWAFMHNSEAEAVILEALESLAAHLTDSEELSHCIAETNASGYQPDGIEIVGIGDFDLERVQIPFSATIRYSGEQESDQIWCGDTIIATLEAKLQYDGDEWVVADDYELVAKVEFDEDAFQE